jgi:hypothetical protein
MYLERVQDGTQKFMASAIKHDFLRPGKDLTLDMTLGEAEILMSANQEVREMADKGTLSALHERCSKI